MPRYVPALLITLLITLLAGAAVPPHAAPSADDRAEVVIRDIRVVDVRQGVVLPARDLVIRGTRIDSVRHLVAPCRRPRRSSRDGASSPCPD